MWIDLATMKIHAKLLFDSSISQSNVIALNEWSGFMKVKVKYTKNYNKHRLSLSITMHIMKFQLGYYGSIRLLIDLSIADISFFSLRSSISNCSFSIRRSASLLRISWVVVVASCARSDCWRTSYWRFVTSCWVFRVTSPSLMSCLAWAFLDPENINCNES